MKISKSYGEYCGHISYRYYFYFADFDLYLMWFEHDSITLRHWVNEGTRGDVIWDLYVTD